MTYHPQNAGGHCIDTQISKDGRRILSRTWTVDERGRIWDEQVLIRRYDGQIVRTLTRSRAMEIRLIAAARGFVLGS